MLVLSIKKLPGYSAVFAGLSRMNLRFRHGDIGDEVAFVIDLDGMRVETYRQLMNLCVPFKPIDITKEVGRYQHITQRKVAV